MAPLAEKLLEWHRTAAVLGARLNHLEVRHEPSPRLLEDINALENDISTTLNDWHASLMDVDVTGRVADAEKSAEGILSGLRQQRTRITGVPFVAGPN